MHHKVGIWIDHKKAVIVSASADRVTATTVESRVGPHARYSGRAGYPTPAGPQEGRGEKKYEERYGQRLDRYYDLVISQLGQAEALLLFGPGEAKLQLKDRLGDSKALSQRVVGIETTDKLTDPQIVAKVKEHYYPRTAERRRRGHRKGTNENGLNLLTRKFQKRFLAQQCKELTNCLADAITATMEAAPVRVGKRYIHHREASRATRASEATWEEALFRQWKTPPGRTFAPWKRLLTHHVPLQDSTHDEDWGAIDLLGASDGNLPVVVELKAPRSNESPAEMLVQATAYAVAVKKAWPQCLRAEWASALKIDADTLPDELSGCELVCAAPSEYWENWTGNTPRARTISADAWGAIAELRKSLEKSGYASTFLRLEHDGTARSPKSIRPVEEQLPTG
jgi:hypothetical protein